MGIVLKSERELAKMRESGLIVRAALDAVEAACVPGVTTTELNAIAERELRRAKATSAFLGYAPGGAPPYPAVLCTSVNAVVVHGIPDRRQVLREGDVIGIDFACHKDGYCADAARTVAVGIVSAPALALISATQECLERAIRACVPGARAARSRSTWRQGSPRQRSTATSPQAPFWAHITYVPPLAASSPYWLSG
jgi:methionyl aminopeptidase